MRSPRIIHLRPVGARGQARLNRSLTVKHAIAGDSGQMLQGSGDDILPTKNESWKMFDRIAPSYDLLNRLISFRRDIAWRKKIKAHLPERNDLKLLDLATGTADVLIGLAKGSPKVRSGVGLDMSANMLSFAKKKISTAQLDSELNAVRGDACSLGLRDNSFDAVTMAFGIRNVPDVGAALREIRRVLKPEGRALILEFSLPKSPLFRPAYLFYFRHILPRIGGAISGDATAYRYLNTTVESFPYGEAFARLMLDAGFQNVKAMPMTFGIATLYLGDK